jgi:hypothetical protein
MPTTTPTEQVDTGGIQGQRVRRGKGSESIRREALQDPRLSFKATGILSFLLSLPDNWRTDAERLSRAKNTEGKAREGREAIQTGLRELEDAGYLLRRKYQDEQGKWRWTWKYSDDPTDLRGLDVSPGQTGNGLPVDGSTGAGSPVDIEGVHTRGSTDKQTKPNPLISSSEEIVSPRARTHTRIGAREATPGRDGQLSLDGLPAPVEAAVPIHRKATETFDRFWAAYPLKKAKGDAWKAWPKAIKAADPDVILAGVGRYVAELRATGAYTAYPATWLNGRRWEDEPATAGNAGRPSGDRRGGGHQPYRDTEDESVFAQSIN